MARWLLRVLFLPFFSFLIAAYLTSVSIGCGGGSVAGTAPTTPAAADPVVTSVAPSTVPAGSAAFSLRVNGNGFVSGSVVSWNGTNLTTNYVSATELNAAVPASLAASGGTFTIAVANPDGQNSGSSHASIVVDNPVPAITSLSPASITAGVAATDVVVTGTNFIQSSVAFFAGTARTTTVQSATQLTMALTAEDLATVGQVNVTAVNPSPGGGVSAPAAFTVTQPPPVITGVTPASLIVGSPATPVTVMGTGFTANSEILVDEILQAPSSLTATAIKVTIPAVDLQATNPVQLSVESAGLMSNLFSLPVVNPAPAIQSLSSSVVTAGSPGFNLTINATGVVSNTQVNVNGTAAAPIFSIGPPTVAIAANLLAHVGAVSISLTNPMPGGGTSNTVMLNVIAGSNYLRTVNLPANALAWNPQQQVIYAAIPASSSSNASSVVAIDPAGGNIVAAQQMPGEPKLLAISGDQQYLYVGMSATAAIARLKLPALAPDIQWSVGPVPNPSGIGAIYDMQVAPGLPHTIAVTQETTSADALDATELAIYDDGVMRPTVAGGDGLPYDYPVNVIEWGADASTIYGTEDTVSGGPEFIYSINAQGATLSSTAVGAFSGFEDQLIYDSSEARLYDPSGDVVDPATGKSLGSFPISSNSFAIDSSQRRVYFMGTTPYPDGVNSAYLVTQIGVYDQDRFTSEGTIALPAVTGGSLNYGGANLIRWGTAGLAFNLGSNIYILDGPFVTPGAIPSSSVGTYATPPPQLSGLSPESVVAGSQDTTITLTGQNMTAATTVSWNNNNLATTFVNNTEVQATIPAAALTTPTAAPLYVENSPGEGISNVLAFSVLPNLGTGTQLAALNLSGSDLVWNASNNLLYVAVTNDDSIHPQTIATVDPTTDTIVSTLPASANPFVLSISGDDQYLYAGFANYANVQRYALPGLTPDLLIPLGIGDPSGDVLGNYASGSEESCDFPVSMEVAPGLDTTIAVTQGSPEIEPLGCGATVVIDGATPRPVNTSVPTSTGRDFSELTWGADDAAVYAQGDAGITPQSISSLTVSSDGITFNQSSSTDIYLGYRPHFDAGTGLIYSDGGSVVQPSNLSQVGNFQASGLMVPDPNLGMAYFLGQTPSQTGAAAQGTEAFTLQIYDLHSYALLDSIVIPNVIGYPNQMIRWGASGIAFTTEEGDSEGNNAPGLTYILSGSEISMPSPSLRQKSKGTERVRLTWKPRMQRSAAAKAF